MSAYRRLFGYIKEIRREAALKALLGLAVSACYIVQAAAMAGAVSTVWSGDGVITLPLVVALVSVIARGVIIRRLEIYSKVMGARVKTSLRLVVFDKLLKLGPGYMDAKRSGKITALMLDGIEALEPFFVNYLPSVATVIISGASIGAYLCSIDVTAGLVVIASMILCVVTPLFTVPLINRTITSYWSGYSTLTAQYIDAIQGMLTLKSLNAVSAKSAELKDDAQHFYKQSVRNTGISLLNSGLMFILTSVTSSIAVVTAAFRADTGAAPIATVSAFLFLAAECARPMLDLNRQWHSSFLGLSVARELFELIDAIPGVVERDAPNLTSLDYGQPRIELKDVSFSYGARSPALRGVTLRIEPGMNAAVVGRSGAGKSTILNLLLRFYDAASGEILINGVDVRDYGIEYLRSKIAVVFQNCFLFGNTIRENIRMSRPDASDDDVISAAKAANAHEFISALPSGYDTFVGEHGSNLSGGERQRVSIARAILKDAPILLLDEATSSVDPESERLIQSALLGLMETRTSIVIAHRLSTIRNADKIFVLDSGALVEQGPHDELRVLDGVYSALIKAQEALIK
jgi:ABC-type multidrug transport system fused ATPase/permease subunit